MKIETRFNIGDLVQTKYSKDFNINTHKDMSMICLEILAIHTETNSVGTEFFYDCNTIHVIFNKDYKDGKFETTISDFVFGDRNLRARQDELKPAPQTVIDLLRPEPRKMAIQ